MGTPGKFIKNGHDKVKNQKVHEKLVYCLQNTKYDRMIRYLFFVIKLESSLVINQVFNTFLISIRKYNYKYGLRRQT